MKPERKLPDYKNNSGRYALITLYPGAAKFLEWKTLYLDPQLGTYAVTAKPDHRLVLLPRNGGMMKPIDFTATITIKRADEESELYSLVFDKGYLIKGPSLDYSNLFMHS